MNKFKTIGKPGDVPSHEGCGFSKGQMREIHLGLEKGLDVSIYTKSRSSVA